MNAFGSGGAFGGEAVTDRQEIRLVPDSDATLPVTAAVNACLLHKEPYTSSGVKRLWPSDLGHCARKAILRTNGVEGVDTFDVAGLQRMRQGVVYEAETIANLVRVYGQENVTPNFTFDHPTWSGKADVILYLGSAQPIIVEHKAVGDSAWSGRYASLPKHDHICQLWLYGELYFERFNVIPQLILYYRGWGHQAEFVINPNELTAIGHIDGEPSNHRISPDPRTHKQTLEAYYASRESGDLPPRLTDREAGCTFRHKPSCAFYDYCWNGGNARPLPF